jgi:hypothetical protein
LHSQNPPFLEAYTEGNCCASVDKVGRLDPLKAGGTMPLLTLPAELCFKQVDLERTIIVWLFHPRLLCFPSCGPIEAPIVGHLLNMHTASVGIGTLYRRWVKS